MHVTTLVTAALSLTAAVFAPGVDAGKRECALCLEEAGGLSGCEAEAHGIPTMACLCNYPGYSTYKLCNSRCEGPDGWPERAPSHVCKNWTTNASTEMFTSTSTATDLKMVVDRAATATEHGHALPNTAAELGSQNLASNTQAHPTIAVTAPTYQAATQSSASMTTTIDESDGAYSVMVIYVPGPLSTGPTLYTTLTPSPNDAFEARSKIMHGTYHFCGVPGGACAKDDNIMPTTTSAIPTFFLTKRHEEHNATAARWSNDTELDFNSTSRPGGQPPTGAAAESKGQRVDSNKEKVWLIAILTAGVVAFAQIKRRA